MANISWGKPTILVADLEATPFAWKETATPVIDTTQLSTTKGEKKEAKVEGGENEDVKYMRNNYALGYNIRKAKGRVKHIDDHDGVVAHKYAVLVIPEDRACPGVLVQTSTVSVEDTFSAEDGIMLAYTHDVLKPAVGDQVKYGICNITKSGNNITALTFKPEKDEDNGFDGNTTYNILTGVDLDTPAI